SVLPAIVYLSTALSSGLDSAKSFFQDEVPAFSIKDGQLSAKTKVPITMNVEDFTFFLDPTGTVSAEDVEAEGNAFALLKDQFV
ncbi:DUF1189 family protein, partial [Alkalihalophilus lindianensis]